MLSNVEFIHFSPIHWQEEKLNRTMQELIMQLDKFDRETDKLRYIQSRFSLAYLFYIVEFSNDFIFQMIIIV